MARLLCERFLEGASQLWAASASAVGTWERSLVGGVCAGRAPLQGLPSDPPPSLQPSPVGKGVVLGGVPALAQPRQPGSEEAF